MTSLHDARHGRQSSLSESPASKSSTLANHVDGRANPLPPTALGAFEITRAALRDAPVERLTVAELLASMVVDPDDAKPSDPDLLAEMLRGLSAQLEFAAEQACAIERSSDDPRWSGTFTRFRRAVEVVLELRRRERAEIRGAA
jgi:hypothetical protein